MTTIVETRPLYGIAGEYVTAEELLRAAQTAKDRGYENVEAYTPFPVEELPEILGQHSRPVALLTLIAGMIGAITGFGMCWYAFVVYYPLDIGGRPNNSWPAWVPITFELTVLFASLTAAISMIVLNGLPRLNHPMFDVPGFERASRDRFFLCVEVTDSKFDAGEVTAMLARTEAVAVSEVRG
jgi:hypothetical protein